MNGLRRTAAVPHEQVRVVVVVLATAWAVLGLLLVGPTIASGHLVIPFLAAVGGVSVLVGSAFALRWWNRTNEHLVRTAERALVTVVVVAAYAGTVSGLILVLDEDAGLEVALGMTGLVALAIQPLRALLQRRLEAFLFGDHDDAYRVVTTLGRHLETTAPPEQVLPRVVETVADALDLSYVAIELDSRTGPVTAAETGAAEGPIVRMQLMHQASQVGWLVLGPRAGERLHAPHRRLLEDLARHVGVAVHAVQLTHDLQRSHAMLVVARDEERRRLQRDLHDGLGPMLAGIDLAVQAARNLMPRDASAADELLARVVTESRAATADVRRLVYDLRPPALDRLGLVGALHDQISRLSASVSDARNGLPDVTVETADLRALPRALELGAFRIAVEALVNAWRHANARTCTIRLSIDDALHVDVTDDGDGIATDAHPGIGIRSMQERAAQLGGRCTVSRRVGGGTRVSAVIPVSSLP